MRRGIMVECVHWFQFLPPTTCFSVQPVEYVPSAQYHNPAPGVSEDHGQMNSGILILSENWNYMGGTDVVHMVTVNGVSLHHSLERKQLFHSILSLFLQWRHNVATDSEVREKAGVNGDYLLLILAKQRYLALFCLTGEFSHLHISQCTTVNSAALYSLAITEMQDVAHFSRSFIDRKLGKPVQSQQLVFIQGQIQVDATDKKYKGHLLCSE